MYFTFTESSIRRITLFLSILLFIISLTQKAYCTADCTHSAVALFMGWLGLFTEIGSLFNWMMNFSDKNSTFPEGLGSTVSWLANPLLFSGWLIAARNASMAVRLSALAMVLALSFLLFDKIIGNEAGHYHQINSVHAGYWLWITSIAAMVAGMLILIRYMKTHDEGSQA
jgi:hypothetical protein